MKEKTKDFTRVDSLSYFQHGDLPRPREELIRCLDYSQWSRCC